MFRYIFLIVAILISTNSYAKDFVRYKGINGSTIALGCFDSCVARGGDAKSCNIKCGRESKDDYNSRDERDRYNDRYNDRYGEVKREDRYRDKYDRRDRYNDTEKNRYNDKRKKDDFDGVSFKCFKKCKNADVSYYDCLDMCEY